MNEQLIRILKKNFIYLAKWLILSVGTGALLGILGGLFGQSIGLVTRFRLAHPWMLYLLPVAGLIIVTMYRLDSYKTSTNLILEGIHSGKHVPLRTAPLIVGATVLTHACGGSAGREGAALQLGGSIGYNIGKAFHLDEKDRKIMLMCGMSAAFSALFGTPLTAAIFSLEVVTVGIMHYSALVPCSIAALTAKVFAGFVGAEGEAFHIVNLPAFELKGAVMVLLLAIICGLLSIFLCLVLHKAEHLYSHYLKNPWIRVVVGAVLVIALTKLIHSEDYLGAGMGIVEKAIEGEVAKPAFLLKIAFTALTLGCGFKGGEIVPTLFAGATFGCLFGQLFGFSPSLCAACGMIAMFCGVTNSPISSLFLAFELCGFEAMPFFLISVSIAYMASGSFGLYHSQRQAYSKTGLTYINRKTS